MPKMKTNRSALKRFKVSGSGKILRRKANKRHLLTTKSRSRKNNLGVATLVHKSDLKRIKKLLPGLV